MCCVVVTCRWRGEAGSAEEIGVDKALLKQTFMYCKEIRARYTVFQTVYDLGLLDELSDRVIAKTETL